MKKDSVACAVITVSDTRTKETDKSGMQIMELLRKDGHHVHTYEIVLDDIEQIKNIVTLAVRDENIEAVLISGGTGIAERDVTIEAVEPLYDKLVPGFGELFRMLSFQQDIGSKAILSRASCGVANRRIVFCLPGSTGAVRLAMEKLILPELLHFITELQKDIKNGSSL